MRSEFTQMCVEAHRIALERGVAAPAERLEWMHYRVTFELDEETDTLVPVFDETLMRDDQLQDVAEVLERLTGRARAANTYQSVRDFLRANGQVGYIEKDIVRDLAIPRSSVKRQLKKLVESGEVTYREEKTRGDGSKRKRFYWANTKLDAGGHAVWQEESDDAKSSAHNATLFTTGDYLPRYHIGIRYHGTSTQGVSCRCGACRAAFEQWVVDQNVSAARQRGETGFAEGLELVRFRRERSIAEFRRALAYAAESEESVSASDLDNSEAMVLAYGS